MLRSLVSSTALALLLAASITTAFAAGDITQEHADQWRASKLVGVAIYGPNDQNVGKVSDILMGKDGKAEYVIVGVGGFLGLGEKDVAIPYDQVKFSDQPVKPPINPVPAANGAENKPMADSVAPGAPAAAVNGAATDGIAPATPVGLGTPAATPGSPPEMSGTGVGTAARSTAYPDHGTIDMTADQIKSAPTFHFAS